MADVIEILGALGDDLITAAALREAGVHHRRVAEWVHSGVLTRLRPGVYVADSLWRVLWPEQRHCLLVRATMLAATRDWVVSHLSAAAMHGLGTMGEWPSTVHVSDAAARGGASAGLITLHRGGPEPDTVVIDGLRVTSLARTVADVVATEPLGRSIPVADAALRLVRAGAERHALTAGVPRRSSEMRAMQAAAEAAER